MTIARTIMLVATTPTNASVIVSMALEYERSPPRLLGSGGMRARPWVIAERLGIAIARVATVLVVAAFVVPLIPHYVPSLFEHFRPYFVGFGIPVIAATAALRQRGWIDAAAIATLANLCLIAGGLGGEPLA